MAGSLLCGCRQPIVHAQSTPLPLQPPVGMPCRVVLKQPVQDATNANSSVSLSSIIGPMTSSLEGRFQGSDGAWIVLVLDKSKQECWIPREEVAFVVYGSPQPSPSRSPHGG